MKLWITSCKWVMPVVWGLLFSCATASRAADATVPTFHSTASEVRLTFFAADQRNRSVRNLQAGDLAVVDNEVIVRKFRSFNRTGETNLDLVMLVDSSQSVLPHFNKEIVEVMRLVSQAQWRAQDHISVMTVNGMRPEVLCADNCRDVLNPERIETLSKGGDTPLFDAIAMASRSLLQRKDPNTRPVIMVFSDGEDTSSTISDREAFEDLLESEAQVYAVDVHRSEEWSSGGAVMRRVAEASGGRYLTLPQGADNVLNSVIEDLHSAYVLTYAPTASTSEFHSVRILPTHNLNLQFRCRRGYFQPGSNDKKRNP